MWLRPRNRSLCLPGARGDGQGTGHKHSVPNGGASGGPQRKGGQCPIVDAAAPHPSRGLPRVVSGQGDGGLSFQQEFIHEQA